MLADISLLALLLLNLGEGVVILKMHSTLSKLRKTLGTETARHWSGENS